MLQKIFLYTFLFFIFLAPVGGETQLRERWSTARDFRVPESVIYDPDAEVIYISNINGEPADKNGEGFLSRMRVDAGGRIQELRWITGLNAPKGMGIHEDKLFVADVDEVVVIERKRGTIVKRIRIPEAKFLNDVAVDTEGRVYISDTRTNKIYLLDEDVISTIPKKSKYLSSPNGLLWEGGALLIGVKDRILRWDPTEEQYTVLAETIGGIDGLQSTGDGDYLISDWQGVVRLVSPEGEDQVLLDVSSQKANTADFCYIPEINLLIIPTFNHNQLWSFQLVR